MAVENDKTPGNGNLGLKGVWAQMTNMTAVLLICLIFYQDRHAALDAAREDRQMFREELRVDKTERKRTKTETTA